jgi:LTXXQ motif family protein
MKRTAPLFPLRTHAVLAAALFLGIAMLANPAGAASPTQTEPSAHVVTVAAHTQVNPQVNTRIDNLHTRLQITAAQESLWLPVAQVMRDNASSMDALRQSRAANANGMSAVEDLRAYGQVVDAHADGVRKLTSAFEPLYNSMSDPQKRNADLIFRGDHHHHVAKKG